MSTLGYGDIYPQTDEERLLCIFLTIISCGFYGYTLNSIGNILLDYKNKQEHFEKKLAKINKYMQTRQVSQSLQTSIKTYLEYKYEEGIDNKRSPIRCLQDLSKSLQEEIFVDVYLKALQKIPSLRDHFSEQFLSKLALKMEEIIYCNGEQIFEQGNTIIDEVSLFFISKGQVQLYLHDKNHQKDILVKKTKTDNCLGQIEFFSQQGSYNLSAKSIGITNIYKLKFKNFYEIIKNYSEDYEKLCHIKDRIFIHNDYGNINQFCYSCQSSTHTLKNCQWLQYKKRQSRLLKQWVNDTVKFEKQFQRLQNNYLHPYKDYRNIKKNQEDFIKINFEDMLQVSEYKQYYQDAYYFQQNETFQSVREFHEQGNIVYSNLEPISALSATSFSNAINMENQNTNTLGDASSPTKISQFRTISNAYQNDNNNSGTHIIEESAENSDTNEKESQQNIQNQSLNHAPSINLNSTTNIVCNQDQIKMALSPRTKRNSIRKLTISLKQDTDSFGSSNQLKTQTIVQRKILPQKSKYFKDQRQPTMINKIPLRKTIQEQSYLSNTSVPFTTYNRKQPTYIAINNECRSQYSQMHAFHTMGTMNTMKTKKNIDAQMTREGISQLEYEKMLNQNFQQKWYQYYFPHNNLENVVKEFNQCQQKEPFYQQFLVNQEKRKKSLYQTASLGLKASKILHGKYSIFDTKQTQNEVK